MTQSDKKEKDRETRKAESVPEKGKKPGRKAADKLKCYVVLELKVVEFEPEFAGKLNFYVSAADHLLKDDNDNPSIGLLVCKSKNETVVKWAFEGIDRPLGIATYELDEVLKKTLAEKLPSIEDIENAIEE